MFIAYSGEQHCKDAANRIKQSVPDAAISYYVMNLTDMNAINENIERMEQDNIAFDVVICYAGLSCFGSDFMKTAANSYELMLDVNYLGHARLLEALHAHARMKDDADVIIVSSDVHDTASPREWTGAERIASSDDISLDGQHGYALTKLRDLYLIWCVHERMLLYHVLAFSPGLTMGTGFFRLTGVLGELADAVFHVLPYVPDAHAQGRNLANLIIDDKWNDVNNAYIYRTHVKRMSKLTYERNPHDELMAFTDGILKS